MTVKLVFITLLVVVCIGLPVWSAADQPVVQDSPHPVLNRSLKGGVILAPHVFYTSVDRNTLSRAEMFNKSYPGVRGRRPPSNATSLTKIALSYPRSQDFKGVPLPVLGIQFT